MIPNDPHTLRSRDTMYHPRQHILTNVFGRHLLSVDYLREKMYSVAREKYQKLFDRVRTDFSFHRMIFVRIRKESDWNRLHWDPPDWDDDAGKCVVDERYKTVL